MHLLVGRNAWAAASLGLCLLATGCKIEAAADADVDALVGALCEEQQRCACSTDIEDACNQTRDTWHERLQQARSLGLSIDRECLRAQLELVANRGCGGSWDASRETHLCHQQCTVFYGNKAEGERCEADDPTVSKCGPGLACSAGTCVSPCRALSGLAENASCSPDLWPDACAIGLRCDPNTRSCTAKRKLGEACDWGDCDEHSECNRDRCVARGAEGESCDQIGCQLGLACSWQGNNSTCQSPAAAFESCATVPCASGLRCGDDSRCHPPAAVGEPCPEFNCVVGAYCNPERLECEALPDGEGQPCPIGECASGLFCDQLLDPMGECLPLGLIGEPCRGHDQCAQAYCPAGYCATRPALGEDCSGAGVCEFGARCDGSTCVLSTDYGPAVCSYPGW